ncbi:hypothetical protein BJ322DRAFT_1114063 [Thelephora terrestris]|uniref:Transmembrane protein n=1 Tax=Thelephora terrestris TaxID=56493 RepID=A0A9P6L1Y2_9AGAM|nr:hypothetical protein BJ322DRAFT_1114063 [Thelephora terrestris]
MPIPSTLPTPPPAATGNHSQLPLGPRGVVGLVFWPILFGAFLFFLIWGAYKWKGGFFASRVPYATPRPSANSMGQVSNRRGSPVRGFSIATLGLKTPPPAYQPPHYHEDDIQMSYYEEMRPLRRSVGEPQ